MRMPFCRYIGLAFVLASVSSASDVKKTRCEAIQSLHQYLGFTAQPSDAVEAFQELVRATPRRATDASSFKAAATRFAVASTKGLGSTELSEAVFSPYDVTRVPDLLPQWRVGEELVAGYLDLINSTRDPTDLNRHSRALLAMVSQEGVIIDSRVLPDVYGKVAHGLGLDAATRRAIEDDLEVLRAPVKVTGAAPKFDELMRNMQDRGFESAPWVEYVRWFDSVWETEVHGLRHDLRFARLLWRTACLARSQNSGVLLSEVNAAAERVIQRMQHPVSIAWVRDAVTRPGPEPRDSGVLIIRGPNDLKPRSPDGR